MRVSIDALPSGSLMSVVRVLPGPMLSFIMPEHKRQIRRYELHRRGGDGRYVKEYIDVPAIMYCFDIEHANAGKLKMYVLKCVEPGKIVGKEVRIGNTYGGGRICWGHDGSKIHVKMRDKIYGFWESPFNDDLTPYAAFPAMDTWMRQPEVCEKYRREFDKMEAYRTRFNNLPLFSITIDNLIEASLTIEQKSLLVKYETLTQEREEAYSQKVGSWGWQAENHPNKQTREKLRNRRITFDQIYEGYSRKCEMVSVSRGIIRRLAGDLAYHIDALVQAHVAKEYQFVREAKAAIRAKMNHMLKAAKNPTFKATLNRYIAHQIKVRTYNHFIDGGTLHVAYEKERAEFARKERDTWWAGGWVKYGEDVNLYDTAFGDVRIVEDAPIFATFIVHRTRLSPDDPLSQALYEYMGKNRLGSMILPVWRLPDNSVVGYVGDVQYVGTLESSESFASLRLYREEDERMMVAAKEIFG